MLPKALLPCRVKKGASRAALARVEKQFGFALPDDYKAALLESDGFEGAVGDEGYLVLWSTSQLAKLNRAYRVAEFPLDGVLIGGDGGGEGFGLRKKRDRWEYVMVPLIGASESDCIRLGTTFAGFIRKLGTGAFS